MSKIKLNSKKVGFCRFKKLDNEYLLTNDPGFYFFLTPTQFQNFIEGKLNRESKIYQALKERGFIRDEFSVDDVAGRYLSRNISSFLGPSLHIVVVTLRCNFRCIYCQTSRRTLKEREYDMNLETAKRVADLIFESPSKIITIEFQGGEPLVNWPVVKFIVKYARKKNETEGKKLLISLVSNFSLMTEEKYKFLTENKVTLCTSLDGPEKLQNLNRPWPKGNGYQVTTSWIKKIKEIEKEKEKTGQKPYHLSALVTISRFSLRQPKAIIDEYLKWGFEGIHLRPLSFLGLSGGAAKERIGYRAEEFLDFWRQAMDYIIDLNLEGKKFFERGSRIMLTKILTGQDCGFLDLRSPCGAAIGQMAYNFNGKVYTCDEGRMTEDDTFMIGNVYKDDYQKIISHPKVKTMVLASTLDNLACDLCVYKPYCGVCPVFNYALSGNLFPQLINTDWCKSHREMFDYLFRKLKEKEIEEIFWQWMEGPPS